MKSITQDRRAFLGSALGFGAATCMFPGMALGRARAQKPNFVFFLVDDMGYGDTGCYGGTIAETPNTDRLAREGMRFTDGYAAAHICSPTRASIMTGKYPARVKITNWIGGGEAGVPYVHALPLEETTVAEALKDGGYSTHFTGKWHLANDKAPNNWLPEEHGFDENDAGLHWGQPYGGYFTPYNMPNLSNGPSGEYLTDRLAQESAEYLDRMDDSKPFALFHWFYTVHRPIEAKQDLKNYYNSKISKLVSEGKQNSAEAGRYDRGYLAMIHSMDEATGVILNKLEEKGFADNTIIIFTSDNGSVEYGANKPLRGGKGSFYEGGIREPLIVKWPGVTEPGSECHEPVITTDFYPTMLAMAGLDLRPEQHMDGVSLVPLLKQTADNLGRGGLFWYFPHNEFGRTPQAVVRMGDYKLIESFSSGSVEMYNLADDLQETKNLAATDSERVNRMLVSLHQWLDEVDANRGSGFKYHPTQPVGAQRREPAPRNESRIEIAEANGGNVRVRYRVPHGEHAELKVFSTTGACLADLSSQVKAGSEGVVGWGGAASGSGMCFVRLRTARGAWVRTLRLLR